MKKVLSFVLSVAMVICIAPVMAFADDDAAAPTTTATATGLSQFSDADSIVNKEAVAVLVGLGIVDGMGDGTFQPAGNLTRAQASKLVATLVKSGDKSDIPAPAEDPFTDVAKTYWGAGAIQFGVDNGYINGMGDGTFHPEDQVTAAQLATMLDKLLGYSVADINYQWPENAMAKATMSGLFDGVSKGANAVLTRDDAAQMLFNALEADTVVKTTDTGSQGAADGDTGYALVPNTKFDYRNRANDNFEQLIEKYFSKVTFGTADSDDPFNRPVTVWKNGKVKVTDDITKNPAVVYTAQQVSSSKPTEKANDQLKDDLDGYTLSANCTVFRNGARINVPGLAAAQNSDEIADAISQQTGNGVLVEFYSDDRDVQIERIVIADYVMVRVTKVNSKDNEIELGNLDKVVAKDNFYSAISSVTADDYILAAVQGNKVIDAYLPIEADENVSVSRITKATKDGLQDEKATIGSEEYVSSSHGFITYKADNGNIEQNKVDANVTGSALTDIYGYLVGYRKDNESAKDWALLTSIYTKEPTNDFGEKSTEYYAQLVLEDGTVDSVQVLYDDDTKSNKYDAATIAVVRNFLAGQDTRYSLRGTLVTYDETADGYKFATNDTKSWAQETPAANLETKATKLEGIYIADPVTVITVSGTKASKLEAKTTSKLKNVDKADYKFVYKKSGNNTLVTTIYVIGESDTNLIKVTADTGEATYGSASKAGRVIEFYTDDSNEVQTLVVASTNNAAVAKGWYAVDEIKEGMNLTADNTANPTRDKFVQNHTVGAGDSAYGDSITVDGVSYTLDENLSIVDLDKRGGIEDIETLVKEFNAVVDNPAGRDPLKLSFAYSIDGDKKLVKQVYIEKNEKTTVNEVEFK